jgi:ketosteroid isomerase-like protein
MDWCEQFIASWNTKDVDALLALTSPDVRWDDVSGHISFEGHHGVREMLDVTVAVIPDYKYSYDGGFRLGDSYVVEWTMSGTAFGEKFACRGASVGKTDDQGRVQVNRDYWDSRSFPGMPAGPENPSPEEIGAKS